MVLEVVVFTPLVAAIATEVLRSSKDKVSCPVVLVAILI
jgi:hypothetical protein